jgi:hypothetical protein
LKRAFLLEVSTVLNIGFDGGFYLRELVSIFEQELMVKLLTSHAQFWDTDRDSNWLDTSKSRKIIDYLPAEPLRSWCERFSKVSMTTGLVNLGTDWIANGHSINP